MNAEDHRVGIQVNAGRQCNAVMQVKRWRTISTYVPCTVHVVRISSNRKEMETGVRPSRLLSLSFGRDPKMCSSSMRPGSFVPDCRHGRLDALRRRVLGQAVHRRRCCSSSRCCCGSCEGAPTHGKSCGSDHTHGATHPPDGSGQARRDGPAWTSPVRRRYHRTFGSDGGD